MTDKIGGIYVDLGLNSGAFSKGLTAAQGQVQSFSAMTKASLGKVGGAAFGGLAQGALATIAPILGLSAAIETTKSALAEFGDISDNAKAAGLDAEFFQGLAYQAGLGGVGVEQLAASLAGFSRNSGLAEQGTGRMVTALAKLNPELLRNLQNATSQEQRVRLAADAIAAAGSASQKAALSVALFGDSGAKLVDVFSGGAAAIDEAANKARALGLVVSRDLIARADELGDEFDTATKVLDLQFKQALVDLAPLLTGTAGLIGGVVTAVRGLIEQFSALDARSTTSLEQRLEVIKQIQATIGKDVTLPNGRIVPENPMAVSVGGADQVGIEEERKQIEAVLALRKALEAPVVTTSDGGGYNAVAQAAIDKAQAVIDSLKFEEEQLGRTAMQQAIYNNLKAAGVTAESALGQQIVENTTKLEEHRTAIDETAAAMQQFGDIGKSAVRGLIDDLTSGKSAAEAFGNVLNKLGDKLLDVGLSSLFEGGTSGGGLLGSLFNLPGHASGTANTGGVRGRVAGVVHGQEAVIPLPNGGRVPVDMRMPTNMGGGAPAPSITYAPVIDARGADPSAIARLEIALARDRANFDTKVVKALTRVKNGHFKP